MIIRGGEVKGKDVLFQSIRVLRFNLRFLILFAAVAVAPALADWELYACVMTTKAYVVGAKLLPSGLFHTVGQGAWQQLAYNHPLMYTVEPDPMDSSSLYVAAGNGLIRVPRIGKSWKILTAQDVTE